MPDGELAFSVSNFAGMTRGTLAFQVAPWLLGAFRYSGLQDWDSDGFDTYYDRSFDIRVLLLDETAWLPTVSVGLRDFLGTGLYSGEYLVATKTVADRFKVTAGLGWGRLGSLDPLGSTGDRPELTPEEVAEGGEVNLDTLFKGDVAAFGGVTFQATERLSLKAEYSSDAYDVEDGELGIFERESPFSFGAEYQIGRDLRLGAYSVYGSEFGVSATLAFNPGRPANAGTRDPAPPPVLVRPSRAEAPEFYRTDWIASEQAVSGTRQALEEALREQRIPLEALSLPPTEATAHVRFGGYLAKPQAYGRTARAMARTLPSSIETFTIVEMANGVPLPGLVLSRTDIERLEVAPDGAERMLARARADLDPPAPAQGAFLPGSYPRVDGSVGLNFRYSLFDPDAPLRYDLGLAAGGSVQPAPGWLFATRVEKLGFGNLTDEQRESNSTLPRVRSDFARYNEEGDPLLKQLYGAYYFSPAQETYGRVTAGYLEQMHAGVSGEVLWAPYDSRLALGAELNYSRQREFDGGFGLMDYDVVTGHASLYWKFTDELYTQVDVGRYLAGDYGATFALERVFDNGWRVGAFATFTDVSAEEFGEGSFDKGITLEIPLDFPFYRSTGVTSNFTIRPVTRDGGARLIVPGRLYREVEAARRFRQEEQWGRFWR